MPGGPCYVRIPRDLMYRENVTATIFKGEAFRIPMEIRPDADAVQRAARVIWESASPLLLVGPEVSQCEGRADVVRLAELIGIPVVQHRSYYCRFSDLASAACAASSERGGASPRSTICLINFGARAESGRRPERHTSTPALSRWRSDATRRSPRPARRSGADRAGPARRDQERGARRQASGEAPPSAWRSRPPTRRNCASRAWHWRADPAAARSPGSGSSSS